MHGAVKYLLCVLEATLLVALLGAGMLAWRLSQGPVTIDVIAPYVANVLESLNPGFRFRIEHAEFRWQDFEGQPQLVVRDVRVLDPAGSVVAGLPSLSTYLSVPALVKGHVAPERISLSNPIIRFVHRADGTLGLGVEGSAAVAPAEGASGNVLLAALIGSLTTPPSTDNPAGYLQSVSIDGTTLMLVDEASGRRWLAPDATLGFDRDDGGVEFRATLPVAEKGRYWDVTAHGRYIVDTDKLTVAFSIDNLRPTRIADLVPQLSVLKIMDLGLSGVIAADLNLKGNSGQIEAVRFDVRGNSGRIRIPPPVALDYPIRSLILKGDAGASLDRISVDEFQVVVETGAEVAPVIKMSLLATNLNAEPDISVGATLDELSIEALKEYWPDSVKPNTRSWIGRNISDGGLINIRASLRLSGPNFDQIGATALNISSELHGISIQYIKGMPRIRNAGGTMTVGLDEALFDLDDGYVPDLLVKEGLRVTRGKLRMHNLGKRGTEMADFDIDIVGDLGSVMRLIDHEPFGYATAVGMDAAGANGRADINLALDFPLVKDLKLDQVEIGVKATLDRVEMPRVAFGLPMSNGRANVVLDREGMDISGFAYIGGIPTSISWWENFAADGFRSRYVLDPVVENEDRPTIGLGVAPFTPPYVDGSINAHVVYTVDSDSTASMTAQVNLTEPAMAIPELSWQKKSGVAAHANVSASFYEGRLKDVSSFKVWSGDNFEVSGAATFGEDTKLRSLSIAPSRVGETQLSGSLTFDDDDGYVVDVSGPALNAVSLWKDVGREQRDENSALDNGSAEVAPTPIKLQVRFDRMWLTQMADFTDVQLDFESDAVGVRTIDFQSRVEGETPFSFALTSGAAGRTFSGSSEDGGSVVRAIGLFDDIVGGQLEIAGVLDPEGTAHGLAEISNFKLVDAPLVARLLSVASLTGVLDELRGEGISFKTLRVPFIYGGSTLAIEDGEMFGNSLGLTGQGRYDLALSSINFDGTLIPAYVINSALNSIPLIGDLFTAGDKGSGIFAATYSYRGDVTTAQPTVNPLAALAPGFLRHIFDIFKTRPQEASAVPAGKPDGDDATLSPSTKDLTKPQH